LKTTISSRPKLKGRNVVLTGFFDLDFGSVYGQREIGAFEGLKNGFTPNCIAFRFVTAIARLGSIPVRSAVFTAGFRGPC
jgi:hypothetical protein